MARLAQEVHLHDDANPDDRRTTVLTPDDDIPDWAISKITNPDAWLVPPTQAEIARAAARPDAKPIA